MLSSSVKSKIKSVLPRPVFEALSFIRSIVTAEKIPNSEYFASFVSGKNGIEVGGPSSVFRYSLPIYKKIESLDGANFSDSTVWEGNIKQGPYFNYYRNKIGYQFISDGTNLSNIGDKKYDFVLSSNCLEHIANPLKALKEWQRILNDNGFLILVLPNKKRNFDHNRPTTTFEHILDDYLKDTSEYDLTHLEEILALHDLSMDLPAGDIHNFKKRSLDNFNNRTLHHHVFDLNVMTQMIEFVGLKCLAKHEGSKDFYLLATKDAKPTQQPL